MVLDRAIGQQMNRIFLDDLQHTQEITVETFRTRSWLQRIAASWASTLRRLL
jgi:hypothetical protein